MTRLRWRLLGLLAVVLLTWARPLPAADKQKIAALPTPYQQWHGWTEEDSRSRSRS